MGKKLYLLIVLCLFTLGLTLRLGFINSTFNVNPETGTSRGSKSHTNTSKGRSYYGRQDNPKKDMPASSTADYERKADIYYLYSSVVFNIHNKEFDKAQETIEKLIKDYPDNSKFHLAAARLYYQKNDMIWAKKEAETALKLTETEYEAWRLLGEIHLALFRKDDDQEHLPKILEAFKNVIKYNPTDNDEMTLRIISMLLLEEQKTDEALIYLKRLLDNYPSHPLAVNNLEKIYIERKDQHALLDLYKTIAENDPEDLTNQFKLADIAFKLRSFDDAEAALLYLDDEMSKSDESKINKENWAATLRQLGYILARKNRLDESLEKLLKSRKLNNNIFTSYYIILVLMQKKDYDTARREMNIALKEFTNSEHFNNLGILNCQLLLKENKKQEAMTEIDKLISSDKTKLEYQVAKASILIEANDYREAKEYLLQLYAKYPVDVTILFSLGSVCEHLKEYNEAEKYLKLCIKLDPENSAAMNYLGYMWAEQETNLQEAENLIKRALEIDPTSSAYLDSLGWVYFKMGNYPKARFYLEKAVKAGVSGSEIYDHIADLYYKLNFYDEALNYWKKALESDDPNLDYEKIMEKIRKTTEENLNK